MKSQMERIAKAAGQVLLKHLGNVQSVHAKGYKDLVTSSDLASEKIILDEIAKSPFAAPVLSEENGGSWKDEETFWVIDPLDGTLNYAFGNPIFGLNIAYVENGKATHAVSYLPYFNELFYAEKNKGAFLNGKKITCPKRLLAESVIFCGYSKRSPEQEKQGQKYQHLLSHAALSIRDPGSTSLGLAYVACGRYGGYAYNHATPWDITAGSLIITEAQGKVTDFQGKAWHPFMKTIVAGNQRSHPELLKTVRS